MLDGDGAPDDRVQVGDGQVGPDSRRPLGSEQQ
jgi:hypothetical protein